MPWGNENQYFNKMTWCRQAMSHYMSQCWPRFLSPHAITRPQWHMYICRAPVIQLKLTGCTKNKIYTPLTPLLRWDAISFRIANVSYVNTEWERHGRYKVTLSSLLVTSWENMRIHIASFRSFPRWRKTYSCSGGSKGCIRHILLYLWH